MDEWVRDASKLDFVDAKIPPTYKRTTLVRSLLYPP